MSQILAVDGTDSLAAVTSALETSDVSVERVPDSATAIERLRSRAFDCVVATARLPAVGGVQFLSRVRQSAPGISRVLLFDTGDADVVNRAHAAGITHVLAHDAENAAEVATRIRDVVVDRGISSDLDEHSRLRTAIVGALPDVVAASSRAAIERTVCEALVESGLYSIGWMSEYHPETGTLSPRTAVGINATDLAKRPFDGDTVPDTVEVTLTENQPQSTTVTVSLGHEERYYGTCQLSTNRRIRAAERDLLATLGRVVTEAIDSTAEDARVSPDVELFSGVLAHELRNHLQIAQSHLLFAQEDHSADAFRNARAALERIGRLTDQAELIAHKTVRPDHLSTRELRESVSVAWERVNQSEVSLSVVDSEPIEAHHSLLEVLLENLFRNSAEHARGAEIRVGTVESGFYVEDTGPGVPREVRDRIFEWGFTTDEANTGFGLVIVDEIATAHGWEVAVTDGSDGGARFEISID